MGPLAGRAPVTSWRISFVAIFSRSHCKYDKKIECQLSYSTLFLHYFHIKLYSFYHKCAHLLTNIYSYGFKIFLSAYHLWQFICLSNRTITVVIWTLSHILKTILFILFFNPHQLLPSTQWTDRKIFTRRNNNVNATSKRLRFDVIMALFLRHGSAGWQSTHMWIWDYGIMLLWHLLEDACRVMSGKVDKINLLLSK